MRLCGRVFRLLLANNPTHITSFITMKNQLMWILMQKKTQFPLTMDDENDENE